MKTATLFEIPITADSKRRKLTALKRRHGIQTHRCDGLSRREEPWLAILPFDDDKGKDIGTIMAESCRLYEEAGYLATGTGELTAVQKLCKMRGILESA